MTAGSTAVTHWAAAPPVASRIFANEALMPPGRKKLVNAGETQGNPLFGLIPQNCAPGASPTASGPWEAPELGSLKAACQFAIKRSPRTVLALMGWLR